MEPMSFDVDLKTPYPGSIEEVSEALREKGFGVLTRIDVHNTLKEKLDVAFRPFTILGACNPPLAHAALSSAPEVGLVLPCNVTVEAKEDGGSRVRIVNPKMMMQFGDLAENESIAKVGMEAYEGLRQVAESLGNR